MKIISRFQALSPRQRAAAPYLFLAAAVFAVYANVYRNAFVLDDMILIVQNGLLRDWRHLPDLLTGLTNSGAGMGGGFYRPLQMLLYFFLYQLFGLSTVAFHTLNVALHAANAGLLYRLGCRLGLRPAACFAAALLWAVHPLFTEAVAYMASTADPLFSFFCLSGLLVLLPDFTRRKIWTASMLFVLALGAKESAIVFPALATVTLFLVSKERLRPAAYLKTWPLWLLAAVYMAGWLMLQRAGYSVYDPRGVPDLHSYADNLTNRVLTSLATLPAYFRLLVWPTDLHMERTYPVFSGFWSWQVMAGTVMVAAAALQIFWGRARRGLALSWGLLWFAAAYAPNTGIVIPINALVAEHWLYLPAAGLFLGMAQTMAVWADRRAAKKVMVVAVTLAAMFLGAKTYLQNRIWYSPGTFYENILACGESTGRIHNNLGLFYWGQGEFEKAIGQFRFVTADSGVRMQPMMMGVHTNFALIYLHARMDRNGIVTLEEVNRALSQAPQIPEAVAELEKALALAPGFYWANQILGAIYAYQGNKEKADFYNNRTKAIMPPPAPAPLPGPLSAP